MNHVLIIGGGPNGLVTATLLARAGITSTILERSDRVGGGARTGHIAPGFRGPTLAHAASLDPAVVRALDLTKHGLRIVRPDVDVAVPSNDGQPLVLWHEASRAANSIKNRSSHDAERYAPFL